MLTLQFYMVSYTYQLPKASVVFYSAAKTSGFLLALSVMLLGTVTEPQLAFLQHHFTLLELHFNQDFPGRFH